MSSKQDVFGIAVLGNTPTKWPVKRLRVARAILLLAMLHPQKIEALKLAIHRAKLMELGNEPDELSDDSRSLHAQYQKEPKIRGTPSEFAKAFGDVDFSAFDYTPGARTLPSDPRWAQRSADSNRVLQIWTTAEIVTQIIRLKECPIPNINPTVTTAVSLVINSTIAPRTGLPQKQKQWRHFTSKDHVWGAWQSLEPVAHLCFALAQVMSDEKGPKLDGSSVRKRMKDSMPQFLSHAVYAEKILSAPQVRRRSQTIADVIPLPKFYDLPNPTFKPENFTQAELKLLPGKPGLDIYQRD